MVSLTLLTYLTIDASSSPTLATVNDLSDNIRSITARTLHATSTLIGPGPNCTAITIYSDKKANVSILSPSGKVIGGNQAIQLPRRGWFNLDSKLPRTLAMKPQKHDLLLQYSNDKRWTVRPQKLTSNVFDCREFKFWLITNFWEFEVNKHYHQGTLNWTMAALDGTKLGGSPQTDIVSGGNHPAASLTSMLDEVVDVYWTNDNAMTFKYGSQTVQLPNATGIHQSSLIGSAPMNVFTWSTSEIL